MTDFDRQPGAIDDPGMKGGTDPQMDRLPPGDRADDTAPDEPQAAELDLPGPDDPVAWNYVQPGTVVFGPGGDELGRVAEMLGTETEGIFHGLAVKADHGTRVVPADAVMLLTPSRVEIAFDAEQLRTAEEHRPQDR